MLDSYGRNIDYIRISITDRCNLRCVYCMPAEGVEAVSHEEILSYGEILKMGEIFASLGFKKVKLTGGEPLVRKNSVSLVKDLKAIPGIEQVTITTNGICLKDCMKELAEAGVDGINLSLDTLNQEAFEKISRRPYFDQVMEGFHEALKYPEVPLKINCVPMGIENQDVLSLAELARDHKVHVRYIEMMPIGLGSSFKCKTEDELLKELKERYGDFEVYNEKLGNGPGHYYKFPGFQGKIGFISAVSHKFCESCNRVRLTSQGYLKTCLQYDVGNDLKSLLRKGASDDEIRATVKAAIDKKPAGHQFGTKVTDHREVHMMSQIGG